MRLFKRSYKNASDEELMRFIALGEKNAFDELYKRFAENLHYYFWRKLKKDAEKAEDFVQDIFTKIIEKPHLFDTSRNFKTWVFSVANNMCKNEYQKMEVRSSVQNGLDESYAITENEKSPLHELSDKEFVEQLNTLLSQMDTKHSEVFRLRHIDGFSLQEIAEVLEIQVGTVKSRLFYATKHITKELEQFNPKSNALS